MTGVDEALKALKVGYTMDLLGRAILVLDTHGRIVYSTGYPPDYNRRRHKDGWNWWRRWLG